MIPGKICNVFFSLYQIKCPQCNKWNIYTDYCDMMSEMGHIRLESNSDIWYPHGTNDSRNSQQKLQYWKLTLILIVHKLG